MLISEWYGDALGGFRTIARTHQKVQLIITPLRFQLWGAVRANCHHPDIGIRLSTRLGVLGTWLGLVGVLDPVLGLFIHHHEGMTKGLWFVAIAVLAAAVGCVVRRGPIVKNRWP